MRSFKKIFSFILCMIIVLSAFVSCKNATAGGGGDALPSTSVTTEGGGAGTPSVNVGTTTKPTSPEPSPEPDPLDEYLISKFDFEGENALYDKAPSGETIEFLRLSGSSEIKSGILTVPSDAGAYASIEYPFESDIYDLKDKTVVFKARINNVFENAAADGVSAILSRKSGYDVYFSSSSNGRVCQFRYNLNGTRPYHISGSATSQNEWRVYAVATSYSEENGSTEVYFLRSTVEDPKTRDDFEQIYVTTVLNCGKNFLVGADPIYIGKRFDHTTGDGRAICSELAEIRVYGKTLNIDELASVSFPTSKTIMLDEISYKIGLAENIKIPEERSGSDMEALRAAVAQAKDITVGSSESDVKKALEALNYTISLMDVERVRDKIGSLTLMPYNNPSLDVPIATGLHAFPGFYDIDGDGDMDFVSSSQSRSYGGYTNGVFMLYKNESGSIGATHFDIGEVMQSAAKSPWFSYKTDGTPVFVAEGGYFYEKLTYVGLEDGEIISGLKRYYKLYDVDGDGLSDAVFPANTFIGPPAQDELRYDENGNSLQSTSSGLTWIKNTGTEKDPVFSTSRRKVLDTKGNVFTVSDEMQYTYFRSFSMFDWDGDGDLDLIAGGQQNVFYYYENKGNKNNPVFDPDGVRIETEAGVLKLDVCRYNMINYEWSGDGIDDLFIGTESGTTVYLVFKGFNSETGAPVFIDKGYMMTDAEHLWVNALSRPTACDFDGDGDTDFIVGDNCGLLWFYENLTGGENPSWAYPVKMRDENGEILVIKAGYNGSFQGTAEAEWGYTVPSACDWDGDGDIDIVANSVTGRIVWFENTGTKTNGQLTRPKAVEVEWTNGNKYPEWLVWVKPLGNELITQHRTTPYATDFNGDGLCDIVMLDHEGYLAFYERYNDNGVLKLKEGERIFYLDGAPLRLTDGIIGKSGRIKFVVTDWDGDGKLDVIVGKNTMVLYKTVKTEGGKYHLENKGELSVGSIAGHNHGFTVVDFNGDGKPDLVSGSESGYFYCLMNNE